MNKDTKIIWKSIDDLKPYEHNAKEHNETQLANLETSFRKYGWQQACLITTENVIVTGHGRIIGAQRAGLTEAPCIYCDDLSEQEIREYRHLDNLLSEGDYIQSELEFELLDLDLSDFIFDVQEVVKNEEQKEKRLKQMQLKAFEHYDYLVFVFKNQHDWLNIVQQFGVEKVDAGYGKTKKVGIGRVLDGKRLLEKMGYKDTDTK